MNGTLDRFFFGDIPYVLVGCDRLPDNPVFLAGSFNPLHKGHDELLFAAEKITDREGILELSITNVDKPSLPRDEVERRLSLLGAHSVVLTRAPSFIEKARLFPAAWFALGYDTAIRLLSKDYHADIPSVLGEFKALQTRFVVAGRLHQGVYEGPGSINIPDGFKDLFIPIPENVFREDISSTQLRQRGG